MLALNYYIHILLTSKYRLFLNLTIIIMIYSIFYGNTILYCMNEGNNLPEIRQINQGMPDLIKQIQAFAGSRASLVEEQNAIVLGATQEIAMLKVDNERISQALQTCREDLVTNQNEILSQKKKIIASTRKIAVNDEIIRSMDRTITDLKEKNDLLERSLIAETRDAFRSLLTTEKEIQTVPPTLNETDPAYRDFKRYPLYPVPFFNENFSLQLKDELYLDDGRIIQQSEGYVQIGRDLLAADDVEISRIRRFDGYFFDNRNLKAQVQSTYYPPNHPLNGFKPGGEIRANGEYVIDTSDLKKGCTCIGYGCICSCTSICCLY